MSTNDIKPPTIPEIAKPETQKGIRGLFSRKQKPSVETTLLKEAIGERKKEPSIQQAFEDQVALEQIKETPKPKQTPITPTNKQIPNENSEEIPLPPAALSQAEEKEKPSIKKLQQEVKELKKTTTKEFLINFNIKGGKKAITLTDLKKVLEQQNPKEYEEHYKEKHYSLWIQTHLFDNELAGKLLETQSKEEAIKIIEEELKPKITIESRKEKTEKDEDHVEEHFKKLQEMHTQDMEELSKVALGKETPGTKEYLTKILKLPDGKTIDQLEDLVIAVNLLKEETYKNLIESRKEDFVTLLKILTQKASQVATIKPAELQANIITIIKEQNQRISKGIEEEKNIIEEQTTELLKKEDEIIKKEEQFQKVTEKIKTKIQELEVQRNKWEEETNEREIKLEEKETEIKELIEGQKEAINTLKEEMEEKETEIKEQQKAILEKKEELRNEELRIVEKKEEELKDVREEKRRQEEQKIELEEKERELQEKEINIETDKSAYEREMQKREKLVQESIDKIINIDNDISTQKKQIEKLKHEIDTEGFQKYLQRALREINTDHIPFKKLPQEEEMKKEHVRLYGKIDECNDAIENNDLEKSKELYKELKKIFEQETLEQEEKDTLYDAIREIYANLHLALLQER